MFFSVFIFSFYYYFFLSLLYTRKLRSAETRTLTVYRTSSCFADKTFATAATRVWNSLPSDLWKADLSYSRFRRSLKTFLFGQPDHDALWILSTAPCRNILTYLLTYLVGSMSTRKSHPQAVTYLNANQTRSKSVDSVAIMSHHTLTFTFSSDKTFIRIIGNWHDALCSFF